MILAPEVYDRVVTLVQTLLESGQGVSYEACDEIGVSRDAVFSIYQQAFIRRQKRLTPVVDAMLEDIVEVRQHIVGCSNLLILRCIVGCKERKDYI